MSTCAHGPPPAKRSRKAAAVIGYPYGPPTCCAGRRPATRAAGGTAVQRPRPREVAGVVAGRDDDVLPVLVVGEDAAVEVAHPGAHGAGQRREVDDVRRALGACVPERVGEDQPALGVRVRHLDGEAGGGRDHVRRRRASEPIRFSHAGRTPVTASGSSSSAIAPARRAPPRPGHVALLAHDVRLRLEEVAAGVEGDGLADQRELRPHRRAARLMAQHDELGSRRARAAGSERPEAGRRGIEDVDAQTGSAAARSASAAGVTRFGASTSSRATFVQRATSAARAATRRSSSRDRAAHDEAAHAACGSAALPAPRL